MPMRTSLFTPDLTANLKQHRFCSEDNDDEIRAARLPRVRRNQRKGAPDNISGRTSEILPIGTERAHRCWRCCGHEARAVYLRSLLRFRFPGELTKRRGQMEAMSFSSKFPRGPNNDSARHALRENGLPGHR